MSGYGAMALLLVTVVALYGMGQFVRITSIPYPMAP